MKSISRLIGSASLSLLISLGRGTAWGADDPYRDINDGSLRTACGPLCCFAALRALGCEASLPELGQQCGWKDGELTPFARLGEVLQRRGDVTCKFERLSPRQLRDRIRNGCCVAILAVRSEGRDIDHAVTVIDADDTGFTVSDYPRITWRINLDRIAENWDGESLVVCLGPAGWLRRNWPWLILPSAALLSGTTSSCLRSRRRARPPADSTLGT